MIGIVILFTLLDHITTISYGTPVPLEIFNIRHSTLHIPSQNRDNNFDRVSDTEEAKQRFKKATGPVKILYQIGLTEEDLPICASNAVCSKIDLYDTPWVERQCRCPSEEHQIRSTVNTENWKLYMLNNETDENLNYNLQNSQYLKYIIRKFDVVLKDDLVLDDSEMYTSKKVRHHGGETGKLHESRKHRYGNKLKNKSYAGTCPSSIEQDDGHTIVDKTRHYKLCNPVSQLPTCRYFRDYTWTLATYPETNITEQTVHCKCPRNSITYLTKREPISTYGSGYTYLFACSPQSRLRCRRKEPCKLFTVRKREELVDEVNTNLLCQCPKNLYCPRHHTDSSAVIAGKKFVEDNIQTYSGFCMPHD